MRVYVAGPMGKADVIEANCQQAIAVAMKLWHLGHEPYVPHLSYYTVLCGHARSYEAWLQTDFVWIRQCEALLRLPGESPGADREVAYAQANGIPVYYSVDELPR